MNQEINNIALNYSAKQMPNLVSKDQIPLDLKDILINLTNRIKEIELIKDLFDFDSNRDFDLIMKQKQILNKSLDLLGSPDQGLTKTLGQVQNNINQYILDGLDISENTQLPSKIDEFLLQKLEDLAKDNDFPCQEAFDVLKKNLLK